MPLLDYVAAFINSAPGPQNTKLSKIWLQALGVEALVVNGPASTDVYKDFRDPQRFEQLFVPLHQENGDTIYSVFPEANSLAHVLRPGEPVPIRAHIDGEAVARYAEIVAGGARRNAAIEWVRGGSARIHATPRHDDLVSVQASWFPGWKAFV